MKHPHLLAAALGVALASLVSQARADDVAEALKRAGTAMQQGDGRAAARLLEGVLPGASAQERPVLLEQLRAAYGAALRQAEAAGDERAVRRFRDNLAILDHSEPAGRKSEKDATPAPTVDPSLETAGELETVEYDPGPPSPPESIAAVEHAEPAVEAAPSLAAPEPAATPPPAQSRPGLAEADAAFRARHYDEAGAIYGALAREGKLPKIRRDPWAYCRMVRVVKQINASPDDQGQWSDIRAEINQIRELSPRNWYAEYLRNLTAELSRDSTGHDNRQAVLRGAMPEDDAHGRRESRPATTTRTVPAAGRLLRTKAAGRAAGSQHDALSPVEANEATDIGQAGAPVGDWQVWNTPSFRILHGDEKLARRVAQIAEATRAEQIERWSGSRPEAAWTPRCDIYLYPDASVFQQVTGQPAESPGFSTMGLDAGRVTARRVNLRADHANLLKAVLPHEVTHVVLADIFPTQQIPRWADEGMAVLSEPPSEQDLRAADLSRPLASGQLFKINDLMQMDYPDGRYWALYYAQSVSLTRFLVERGSPTQFVEFLHASQRLGPEAALQQVYKVKSIEELQQRWLTHARSAAPSSVAAADGPEVRE